MSPAAVVGRKKASQQHLISGQQRNKNQNKITDNNDEGEEEAFRSIKVTAEYESDRQSSIARIVISTLMFTMMR